MHGSRSTARSSLSLVLHRKSTRAAGRRNRRPGRWGIIAALVFIQLYVGWTFADMPRGDLRAGWFDWHKTLGFTVLLLGFTWVLHLVTGA